MQKVAAELVQTSGGTARLSTTLACNTLCLTGSTPFTARINSAKTFAIYRTNKHGPFGVGSSRRGWVTSAWPRAHVSNFAACIALPFLQPSVTRCTGTTNPVHAAACCCTVSEKVRLEAFGRRHLSEPCLRTLDRAGSGAVCCLQISFYLRLREVG